ncbi:phage repressor protein CI [Pantoea ananatis]|jgi:DNA-binding transcriptional regulator YiaG|uniref:phage repressor protein CI n=1 Tax=Pantoea ananas TaxID=553 RepID=UPI0025C807B5|nr:phage repressor protein CI [Pantoea ananatis]MDN4134176.1 phage repressor protein CI [Pantoea ananatis]
MSNFESNAQDVIERLLSAYGVTTQRALAEALNVPSNNVSAWSQRNSVPGSAIIKCVLDTGVDLQWLVNGELAKANYKRGAELPSGESILNVITSNRGKAVLRRIMDAYGFTPQKQLCELLGISSGTVNTWIRRNYFPGDVVAACALETGVDLQWLALGKCKQHIETDKLSANHSIPRRNLRAGSLQEAGLWEINLNFISQTLVEPVFISSSKSSWVVDMNFGEISNGRWLMGIDGKYDVYDIALLPGRKISVTNKVANFICGTGDVKKTGKVILTLDYNF